MEKSIRYYHAMSDRALMAELGQFIRHNRLQQNKTQQQVATTAGVNRSTVVQIENGSGGTLLSLIQILRALEMLQIFEQFEIKPQFSPLLLAELELKKRKRARAPKKAPVKKPKSEW